MLQLLDTSKKIACIGSREVSKEKIELMESIGKLIVASGGVIASGNALGSDQAYARGGNEINPAKVFLYLPWPTYEKGAIIKGNKLVALSKTAEEHMLKLASEHHPAWDHLSDGVKKLMSRNAAIVRGSKAVIACLNHSKKGGGGTGHGWRVAEALQIPRLDISGSISLTDVQSFLKDIL